MQSARMQKCLRRAAGAGAVLGLALPVLAQTAGNQPDTGSFWDQGNTATRPAGQLDRPGDLSNQQLERSRDTAANLRDQSGTSDRNRSDLGSRSPATRPSGISGRPIGPADDMRDRGQMGDPDLQERQGGQRGQGWVRVGYDFDDDGRFDSFDYIPAREVDRLRAGTPDRAGRGMGGEMTDRARLGDRQRGESDFTRRENLDREDRQMLRGQRRSTREQWQEPGGRATASRQQFGRMQRIQGEVVNITTIDVRDRQHVVAEIETQDNRQLQVDLGPREQFSRKVGHIRQGDRISVQARQSQFHDRSLLIAERLEHDGRTFTLESTSQRFGRGESGRLDEIGGQQYSGEVLSTRLAQYAGHDHLHLVARVQLDDQDWTAQVDLGPVRDLDDLDVQSGDFISVVARDGCINGQTALIADELRTTGGQFVQLDNYEAEEPLQLRGRPVGPGQYDDSDTFQDPTYQRRSWQRGRSFEQDQGTGSQYWHEPRSGRRGAYDTGTRGNLDTTDRQTEIDVDEDEIEMEQGGVETEIERDDGKVETETETED